MDQYSNQEEKTMEIAEDKKADAEKNKKSMAKEIWDWTKAIGIAVILALLIRTFVFAPTIVDGESMMSTLKNHERLIVNKFIYRFSQPKRGDIIIFHAVEKKDFIKRVIGVAGDRIEMKNDTLYINGKVVEEPYLKENKERWHEVNPAPFTEDFVVDSVPEGTVYVLGDNRRNSTDSRIIGPVPLDQIVGRADLSFWPIQNMRLLK